MHLPRLATRLSRAFPTLLLCQYLIIFLLHHRLLLAQSTVLVVGVLIHSVLKRLSIQGLCLSVTKRYLQILPLPQIATLM